MNIHSVDKRDRILDAATKVFAKRGCFGAQVADIAKRAGVASGTVYLYFKSKDDLLLSLFERTMHEAITEGRAAITDAQAADLLAGRWYVNIHTAAHGGGEIRFDGQVIRKDGLFVPKALQKLNPDYLLGQGR